jgi:O-antigen/teichoic acid export membrane protein
MSVASLAGQAIGFAVLAFIARNVPVSSLGAFGFATSVAAYLGLPVAGLGWLTARDVAVEKYEGAEASGLILPIVTLYGAVIGVVVYFAAPVIAPTALAATMLRIATLTEIFTFVSLDWLLQGLQSFRELALARLLGQVVYGVGAFLFVTRGKSGIYWYASLNTVGVLTTAALTWFVAVRVNGRPRWKFGSRELRSRVSESLPFSISSLMMTIYLSADFVLLGAMTTTREVGQYFVAYKIPLALGALSTIWGSIFFPNAARESAQAVRRQVGKATTGSLIVMIPVCVGAFVVGHPFIELVFGRQYGPAGFLFALLMVTLLAGIVNGILGTALGARGEQPFVARTLTTGAVINAGLNVAVIPFLGAAGSAGATIVTELLMLCLLAARVRNAIGVPRVGWRRVGGAALASAVMAIMIAFPAGPWPVVGRIVAGAAVFVSGACLTRTFRVSDLRHLRHVQAASERG